MQPAGQAGQSASRAGEFPSGAAASYPRCRRSVSMPERKRACEVDVCLPIRYIPDPPEMTARRVRKMRSCRSHAAGRYRPESQPERRRSVDRFAEGYPNTCPVARLFWTASSSDPTVRMVGEKVENVFHMVAKCIMRECYRFIRFQLSHGAIFRKLRESEMKYGIVVLVVRPFKDGYFESQRGNLGLLYWLCVLSKMDILIQEKFWSLLPRKNWSCAAPQASPSPSRC